MKSFSSTISLKTTVNEQEQLKNIFASEDKELSNNRGFFEIKFGTDETTFILHADDAVALRAISNSVCKTLVIFEKMQEV